MSIPGRLELVLLLRPWHIWLIRLYKMTEGEQLNVDDLISRLLEGKSSLNVMIARFGAMLRMF